MPDNRSSILPANIADVSAPEVMPSAEAALDAERAKLVALEASYATRSLVLGTQAMDQIGPASPRHTTGSTALLDGPIRCLQRRPTVRRAS
jgi:hypothetical protein